MCAPMPLPLRVLFWLHASPSAPLRFTLLQDNQALHPVALMVQPLAARGTHGMHRIVLMTIP